MTANDARAHIDSAANAVAAGTAATPSVGSPSFTFRSLIARATGRWQALTSRRGRLLCSLSVRPLDNPSLYLRVEARARTPRGFTVRLFDASGAIKFPDGAELVSSDDAYDWRKLAYILCRKHLGKWHISKKGGAIPDLAMIKVRGERGMPAAVLRFLLADDSYAPYGYWPYVQSDAALAAIATCLGRKPSKQDWVNLRCIAWAAIVLGFEYDFLTIQRIYREWGAASLKDFHDDITGQAERKLEAEKTARLKGLAPFREEINTIGQILSWGPGRSYLISFLENYVLEHGHMPRGKTEVKKTSGSITFNLGVFEFDENGRYVE
jgi:hypothetical protein